MKTNELKEIRKNNELFFDKIEELGWGLSEEEKEEILTGELDILYGKRSDIIVELDNQNKEITEIIWRPYCEDSIYNLEDLKLEKNENKSELKL